MGESKLRLAYRFPDAEWDELVMAIVALKPGQGLTADELIAHCRRSVAGYEIPRRVEFTQTELPKSGFGKILSASQKSIR